MFYQLSTSQLMILFSYLCSAWPAFRRRAFFALLFLYFITAGMVAETEAQQTSAAVSGPPEGAPYARQFLNGRDYEGTDLSYGITEADDGSILFGNDQVGIQMLNGSGSQRLPLPGNALASTFIRDAQGRLYTASYDLIARLERGPNQQFAVRRLGTLLPETQRPLPFVHDTAPVGDTALVFVSLEAGFLYDTAADSMFRFEPEGDFVAAAQVNGHTYITDTEAGLLQLSPEGRPVPVETPFSPGFTRVMNLGGRLTVYLPSHQLWQQHESRDWELVGSFPFFADKPENYILSLGPLRSGNLVFTSLGGVHIYSPEGNLLEHYSDQDLLPTKVSGEAFESRDGRLWVSSPAGLTAIERNEALRQFPGRGLPRRDITDITPWNNMLFAGTTSGLGVLEPGKNFRWLREDIAIFQLLTTPRGMLVASSEGIFMMDEDFTMHRLTGEVFVRRIFPDPELEDVFYYHDSPNGLVRLDLQENYEATETRLYETSQQLLSLAHGPQGNLWIAVENFSVLELFTRRDEQGRITEITGKRVWDEARGLPGENRNITTRLFGELSFMTAEGIYKLSDDGGRAVPDSRFAGLLPPDSFPLRKQARAGENAFWLLTNTHNLGKLRYHPGADSLSWEPFDIARFRPEGEISRIVQAPQQRLYIASSTKIAYLNTARPPAARPQPELHFTGVTAGADSLVLAGWTQRPAPPFELSYAENSLRFTWSLISFSPPDFNHYQFRMAGTGENWSEWRPEVFAEYRNLREGSYTFEVRGRDLYGQVSAPQRLSFTITPPWFRSAWAWGGYIFLGLLLITAAIRVRTQKLLARQQQLEDEVRERTHKIQHQKEELERLNSLKTRFFANISHEFRTPLTLIKGPARQLEQGRVPAEKLADTAKGIINNADRLLTMVEEVLQLSKMESGQMRLEVQQLSFSRLLRRVCEWYRPLAASKGLGFTIAVDEAAAEYLVYADARQMELLCSNLLSNAVKYTARGRVAVRLSVVRGQLSLEIEDTGSGIPEEERSRIFERFYRSASTMLSRSGSGIGLDLVNFIAGRHSLKLDLSSTPGQGTCISVGIPGTLEAITGEYVLLRQDGREPAALPASDPENLPAEAYAPAESEAENLSEEDDIPLVLLIDDNAGIRQFIRSVLGPSFRFTECADGRDGFTKAIETQPDIILSDVMMPGIDGISLAQKLKSSAQTAHIPLLLITAKAGEANELSGLEAGANDYIAKPFSPDILRARVQGQLALLRELRRELQRRKTAGQAFPEAALQRNDASAAIRRLPPKSTPDVFMQQVFEHIRQQLSNPEFGVEQLARSMNKSTSALYRQLKKHTDYSAKDLIRRERLRLAKTLLDQKEGSITEVAYAVGYNSLSYFSRVFREEYGTTPSDYTESRP